MPLVQRPAPLVIMMVATFLAAGPAEASDRTDGRNDALRIALVADPHVSVREEHAVFRNNLERIIEEVNRAEVDAVLIAGDLTTHGLAEAAGDFLGYVGRFNARTWYVPGNHDVGNKPLPDRESHLSDQRIEQYEQLLGPSFFTEQIAPGFRLVAVNSSLFGTGLQREPEQWEFLQRQLAEPAADQVIILLSHFPLFVNSVDEPSEYFNIDPDSRRRLLELIRRGGVKVVLSGHTHRPLEHQHEGVMHLTAPPVSFGLPRNQQPEGWTLLTVQRDGTLQHEHRYLQPEARAAGAAEGAGTDLRQRLEELGPIAVLPMADQDNYINSFLRKHGGDALLKHLTAEQLLDPDQFNAEQYKLVLYLGGEQFLRSVDQPGDAEGALAEYIAGGGTLAVLSSQPFPFYYDQRGREALSGDRFGITLLGNEEQMDSAAGFERPPAGQQVHFVVDEALRQHGNLAARLDYPQRGDLRWRPRVRLSQRDRYEALITLQDAHGSELGDGVALAQRVDPEGERAGRTLYAASVLTQAHPQRDAILAAIFNYLASEINRAPQAQRPQGAGAPADADPPDVSDRVHIFYYNWYGAPPHQRQYVHWQQGAHQPPEQIGADYYPKLGAYSSSDPQVLRRHMQWLRQARIGVIVLTWWGRGSYEDRLAEPVLDAAAEADLKVCFHIEPYQGRDPGRTVEDMRYLIDRYGDHPAFYRVQEHGQRPMFYVFKNLLHSDEQWRAALQQIRGTEYDSLVIAQTSDLARIIQGGFDGGFTYDILSYFNDPDVLRQWVEVIQPDFAAADRLFIPSVGPGYVEDRAVPGRLNPPRHARDRDGGTGATYAAAWQAVIDAGVPFVTITSFNEWHEGSQIEPAVEKITPRFTYPGYGAGGPEFYLELTGEWVRRFEQATQADR